MHVTNIPEITAHWNTRSKRLDSLSGLDNIHSALRPGHSAQCTVEFIKDGGNAADRRYRITRGQDGAIKFNRIGGWHSVANFISGIAKCFGFSCTNNQTRALNLYAMTQNMATGQLRDFHESAAVYPNDSTDSDSETPLLNDKDETNLLDDTSARNKPAEAKPAGKTAAVTERSGTVNLTFAARVSQAFTTLSDAQSLSIDKQKESLTDAPLWRERLLEPLFKKQDLRLHTPNVDDVIYQGSDIAEQQPQVKLIFTLKDRVISEGSNGEQYALTFQLKEIESIENVKKYEARAIRAFTVDREDETEQEVSLSDVTQHIDTSNYIGDTELPAASPVSVKPISDKVKGFNRDISDRKSNARPDATKTYDHDSTIWMADYFGHLAENNGLDLTVKDPEAAIIESGFSASRIKFSAKFVLKDKDNPDQNKTYDISGEAVAGYETGSNGKTTVWGNITLD